MRRGCRVRNEALRSLRDCSRYRRAVAHLETRKQASLPPATSKQTRRTALLHLAAGELVLRMARQAGVENAGYLRMTFEKAGDRRRCAALPIDPQLEGLEALEQQPGVERGQGRPGVPIERAEIVLDEFLRGEDRAAETAPLAVDVLRRRIDNDIGTEQPAASARAASRTRCRRREWRRRGASGARTAREIDDLHRRV